MACKRTSKSSEAVTVDHFYRKTNQSTMVKLDDSTLVKKQGLFSEGYIYCEFSRSKQVKSAFVTDLSQSHFINIGVGNSGKSKIKNLFTRKTYQNFILFNL